MGVDWKMKQALDFEDVLIVPRPEKGSHIKSRKEVHLECSVFINNVKWTGIPIIASNMDNIGTFEVAKVLSKQRMLTCLNKKYEMSDFRQHEYVVNYNYVIPSSGTNHDEIENLITIASSFDEIKFVCLDVANGYLNSAVDAAEYLRKNLPNKIIIAGNVVTPEGCKNLHDVGIDICKVGIGNGSVCTTRTMTGIGYPQFTAIRNCNKYHMVSDGGCTTPGDIAKAFAVGADFVMLGGMLAGHNETGTDFYGMSSKEAMERKGLYHSYKTAEGKYVNLCPRGKLEDTINDILGGLRSTCTYLGHNSLQEVIISGDIEFVRVNRQKNGVFDDI